MDNFMDILFSKLIKYLMVKQKRTKQKKTKQTTKRKQRKKLKLRISENKYKQLIKQRKGKKKMSLKDLKLLDDALYIKYCKCLKIFEFKKKDKRGYPICMNSVYKNRGFKPPKNATRLCKLTFNKNVDK